MDLHQWWSLQDHGGVYKIMVSRYPGRFIYPELNHFSHYHHDLLCQLLMRKSGYKWVSIALVTFIGILAYHTFWQLRHTKLWKKMPKLNLFNRPNIMHAVNDPVDNSAVKDADFSRLREPLLEDRPQPNYAWSFLNLCFLHF